MYATTNLVPHAPGGQPPVGKVGECVTYINRIPVRYEVRGAGDVYVRAGPVAAAVEWLVVGTVVRLGSVRDLRWKELSPWSLKSPTPRWSDLRSLGSDAGRLPMPQPWSLRSRPST